MDWLCSLVPVTGPVIGAGNDPGREPIGKQPYGLSDCAAVLLCGLFYWRGAGEDIGAGVKTVWCSVQKEDGAGLGCACCPVIFAHRCWYGAGGYWIVEPVTVSGYRSPDCWPDLPGKVQVEV